MNHYDTDHLTTEEVKAVCKAIWDQIMDDPEVHREDILDAPMFELQDEYDFWYAVFSERMKDAGTPPPEND